MEQQLCLACPWEKSNCFEDFPHFYDYNYANYYCFFFCQDGDCDYTSIRYEPRFSPNGTGLAFNGCQSGFGMDLLNNFKCTPCPQNCTECIVNKIPGLDYCSGCTSNHIFDFKLGSCVAPCNSDGYYDFSIHSCEKCPNGCNTCYWINGSLEIVNCNSCHQMFTLNDTITGQKCLKCPDNCSDCVWNKTINSFSCLGCLQGFYFNIQTGTCQGTCELNSYYDSVFKIFIYLLIFFY